jgi:hypothetical protein
MPKQIQSERWGMGERECANTNMRVNKTHTA